MSFPAKYEGGFCPAGCGSRIHEGDMIRKDDDLGFVHDACRPKPSKFDLQPGEVVCPDCFQIRPCQCL